MLIRFTIGSRRWKTWCQETLGHLSQGTGWYLASWSCLSSAVLGHPPPAAVPQHSTAQAWPTGQITSSALAKMTQCLLASSLPPSWTYRETNYHASIVNLSRIYHEPLVYLSWTYPRCQQLEVWRIRFMNILKFGLKWVHMVRYELILKLDGALWHTIISGQT